MAEAVTHAIYDSGAIFDPYRWWPRSYIPYSQLFFLDFNKGWYSDFKILKRKYSLKKISGTLGYPTAIWLILAPALRVLKVIEPNKKKRIELVFNFLDMIQYQKSGDIFCEDGQNVVWNEDRVKKFMQKTEFIDVSSKIKLKKLFSRLNADLISWVEAVFWSANCAAREIHGPYEVVHNKITCQLIVREYYHPKESLLEPKTSDLRYSSIRTYSLYDKKVKFHFTVLNDYSHDKSLLENLIAFHAEAKDKKKVVSLDNEKKIEKVCGEIEKKIEEIAKHVEKTDRNQQVLGSVRRIYFRVHKLKTLAGKRWQPDKKLLQKVGKDLENFKVPDPPKITRAEFYKLMDPRVE